MDAAREPNRTSRRSPRTTLALAALVALALVAALAVFSLWKMWLRDSSAARAVRPAQVELAGGGAHAAVPRPELGELTRAVTELESAVAELARRVERLENERRSVSAAPESAAASSPAQPADSELDPRWYLERYVASFRGGRAGDEFYRLAVQAHAVELLDDIAALIGDARQPGALRESLVAMLGDIRFRGNSRAIDALLGALMNGADDELATMALNALGKLADVTIAGRLASIVWSLPEGELRHGTLLLIVLLYGPDANRAVQRLMAGARTDADQTLLISLLTQTDPDTALEVIRAASFLAVDVRMAAAEKVGTYHSPQALALITAWLGYERDEGVRDRLGAAHEDATTVPRWDAMRATGPPDADPSSHDDENAWACSSIDMGLQWLELTYQPALRASLVRVVELNVGGAVTQLIAFDEGGGQHTLLPGGQRAQLQGVCEISFAPTAYRVARLRVVLDTDKPGWNEIDAVEIVGPDGRAWASFATASSNYGQ